MTSNVRRIDDAVKETLIKNVHLDLTLRVSAWQLKLASDYGASFTERYYIIKSAIKRLSDENRLATLTDEENAKEEIRHKYLIEPDDDVD